MKRCATCVCPQIIHVHINDNETWCSKCGKSNCPKFKPEKIVDKLARKLNRPAKIGGFKNVRHY